MAISKDSSTSSSNRYSLNGHNNTLNITNVGSNNSSVFSNSSNNTSSSSISSSNTLPSAFNHHHDAFVLQHQTTKNEQDHSHDLEAFGNSGNGLLSGNRTKKNRTPSPPLSPDHRVLLPIPILKRSSRWSKKNKPCLILAVLILGLLLPTWIFATGIITLDSFNDVVRYLPGYHYFANNLLYLVMFLLLSSFTVLATLPILPIFILGLPLHLLIFSIFNKLMTDWLWWCIGCYSVLFIAPVAFTVTTRINALVHQLLSGGSRRETLIRHKSASYSPSLLSQPHKYSIFHSGSNNLSGNNIHGLLNRGSTFGKVWIGIKVTLEIVGRRIESILHLFSVTSNPRTSTRWRLALALLFWFSYVVPVTLKNEARDFNPARAAASFDIDHPSLLCPSDIKKRPRHESFDGYWQEYLQFHKQMVLPEEDGGVPVDQKRFLIFQPSDDGLGNRLQALLSTVVLGMLSRRAIILDWIAMPQCNANFTDLFLPPEGLSWDLNTTLPNHKDLPAYKTKPEIWYPYCRNCALRSPITPESTWSTLLCEQDFGINTSQPIVQILSTQWFLPVIQHNPYWRSQLCEIFPEGGKNAFQVLAERLLKPSSAVQRQIDSVLDRIPDDATLIGLQVRRTENNAVGQGIEDAFLSCAAEAVKEEEVKATAAAKSEWRGIVAGSGSGFVRNRHARGVYKEDDADGERSPIVQQGRSLELDSSSLSSLIRHDQGASLSSTTTKPRFAYFLATDYRPTRAHFQNVLGDQLFVLENTFQTQRKSENPSSKTNKNAPGEPSNDRDDRLSIDIETYDDARQQSTTMASTASQSEAVARNSVRGVQTAVAEMFLLAQADRIISSPYSTFGYFAHAYSNVQPNIVKRDGTCIKRRSTQPCFQYWFGFANGGAQCSISSTVEMSEDYDCWL